MKKVSLISTLAAVLMLGFGTSAQAAMDDYYTNANRYDDGSAYGQVAPEAGEQPGIAYVTGGIGDDERFAMEEMRHNYNLRVTNVDKEGAFAGDAHVSIYDSHGTQLVSVDAGPLFYAEVVPGKYTVVATNEYNVEKRKTVRVSKSKASEVTIIW